MVNEQAHLCQKRIEYVMKENGNKHFATLNKCADELSKNTIENRNDNLFSLALERIAQTEDLPEPEDVNGIDLKVLYSWMANAMAGYPIDIDEGPTKDFLRDCYTVSVLLTMRNFPPVLLTMVRFIGNDGRCRKLRRKGTESIFIRPE